MKKLLFLWIVAIAMCVGAALTGCKTSNLEVGGAYSQTNTVPDKAFFAVDSAFTLAHSMVNAAFESERENRQLLWKISPNIKHSLDAIRPTAWDLTVRYTAARKTYLKQPIPANLTRLQTFLSGMQNLANTAQAALNTKGN